MRTEGNFPEADDDNVDASDASDNDDSGTPAKRPHKRGLIAAGVAVALALALAGVWVYSQNAGSGSAIGTVQTENGAHDDDPADDPSPDLTDLGPSHDAQQTVSDYVLLSQEAYTKSLKTVPSPVQSVSEGAALTHVQSQLAEQTSQGIRQVGVADIVELSVQEEYLYDDPPTVVVRACIDRSGVSVVDSHGGVLEEANPGDAAQRTLYTYVVKMKNDQWRVAEQRSTSSTC